MTPDWRDQALCAQVDPELWFPEKGAATADAKGVCARCPVTADCLEYAVTSIPTEGIWGGVTYRQLAKIRRDRGLTKRRRVDAVPEDDVAAMLAAGQNAARIAARLGVHADSVRRVRRRLLQEQGGGGMNAPNLRTVLVRADRRWSLDNEDSVSDPPRMDALVTAVEHWADSLETEAANTRALLGRVLLAVNERWDQDGDVPKQVSEALRQLRLVRAYLLSLQHDEQGAA